MSGRDKGGGEIKTIQRDWKRARGGTRDSQNQKPLRSLMKTLGGYGPPTKHNHAKVYKLLRMSVQQTQ